jgi:hypothetical protein
MTRHEVPGTDHWFDFRDLDSLTSQHQDEYLDLGDQLRAKKREAALEALAAAHPGMIPDPDQDIPVTLDRKETRPVRDLVLSWILEGSSFGVPLPDPLPLLAANVLRKALEPFFLALNGNVPKPPPPSPSAPSITSSSTSPGNAAAPRPEQPAESSGTPAG